MLATRLVILAACTLPLAGSLTDARTTAAAAKEPPAALLAALDHEMDGEALVRAAEALLEDYGDHPRAAEAAELLADYRYALGEYQAAARHYATAATLSSGPERVHRLLSRGRALLGAGDSPAASAVFEEVLTLVPASSQARLGLADAALLAGETKRAVTLYSNLLDQSPADLVTPIALAQRFRALDELGRTEEALADARRLVEAYPRSSEAAALRDRLRREERERAASAGDETPPGQKAPATPAPGSRVPVIDAPAARTGGDDPARAKDLPEGGGPGGGYSLQLGAFGNEGNAQDLARQLEQLKMPDVRIEKERRGGRIFYRVRCGSYNDPAAAEADGQRLGEHGLRYQVVAR